MNDQAVSSLTHKRARMAAWLQGDGIEIGALYRPLALPEGARVRYVDRMTEPDLRRHYPELAGEDFVPISIIGNAEDLSNFANDSVDFIVANHLMEHMEYPIRSLCEFHRVLRPGGVLYMALPDARTSIDVDRQLTSLEHLLEEHRHGAGSNRREHYVDWVANAEKHFHRHRPEDIGDRAAMLDDMDLSIHFHVWRADTFLEFFMHAKKEAQLEFELLGFAPPEYPGDPEFILVLAKGESAIPRIPPARIEDQLRLQVQRLEEELGRARSHIAWMESSRFWKLRDRVVHARKRLRPTSGALNVR